MHAAWHGLTPTDLVFPFFVFIAGISAVLSLSKRLDAGAKPAQQQELDLEQLLQGGGGAAAAGDSNADLMRQLQGD